MRILLAAAVLAFNVEAKSLFSNDEQKSNSKYIGALKDLVISTQKTRGLTNSYLNGNRSASLLIHSNKRDMKKAIGIMEGLPLAEDPNIGDRADEISQSLIKLNNIAFDQKPAKTFKDYTAQIEQILMLAQTISKKGSKDLNPLGKDASVVMMEVILPLTEQIGKMRGMGSGVVARGKITEVQKFAILSMIDEIESLENQLQSDMNTITSKYSDNYDSNMRRALSKVHKDISNYVTTTKTKVMSPTVSKDCNAGNFFNKGTEIISTLIKIYDLNNKAILNDSKGWI